MASRDMQDGLSRQFFAIDLLTGVLFVAVAGWWMTRVAQAVLWLASG